jgi:hypothetical protein
MYTHTHTNMYMYIFMRECVYVCITGGVLGGAGSSPEKSGPARWAARAACLFWITYTLLMRSHVLYVSERQPLVCLKVYTDYWCKATCTLYVNDRLCVWKYIQITNAKPRARLCLTSNRLWFGLLYHVHTCTYIHIYIYIT